MQHSFRTIEISDNDTIIIVDIFAEILIPIFETDIDFFCSLQNEITHSSINLTAHRRQYAEESAFKKKLANPSTNLFSIENIYKYALENLGIFNASELQKKLITSEIKHFSSKLLPHKEIIEALKTAFLNGAKIYGISDYIYSSEVILEIANNAGLCFTKIFTTNETSATDLRTLCSVIYNSDAHKKNNAVVIGRKIHTSELITNIRVKNISYLSAKNDYLTEISTSRSCIAPQIFPSIGYKEPCGNNYSVLSYHGHDLDNFKSFGFYSVGPVFFQFAKFIEICTTPDTHLAFLMRDGHLPKLTYQAINNTSDKNIDLYINRHIAISSSLRSIRDVSELVSSNLYNNDVAIFCNIINLKSSEKDEFISDFILKVKKSENNHLKVLEELATSDKYLQKIINLSTMKAGRLKKHINMQLKGAPVDSVTLIDLGYAGTIQDHLNKISDELNITFNGIYLITDKRCRIDKFSYKKSFIDYKESDPRVIDLILKNIALLEAISSKSIPSFYDYDEYGNPLFSDTVHEQINSSDLNNIHEGVTIFSKIANENLKKYFRLDSQSATIDICRLFYYPTNFELSLLKKTEFHLGLGTDVMIPLFDSEKFARNFKELGLLSLNDNQQYNYYALPAFSSRGYNLLATNSMLTQDRYAIEFSTLKLSYKKINVHAIAFDKYNFQIEETVISASETQLQYYTLSIRPSASSTRFLLIFNEEIGLVRIHECLIKLNNLNIKYSLNAFIQGSTLLPYNFQIPPKKMVIEINFENINNLENSELILNFELTEKD